MDEAKVDAVKRGAAKVDEVKVDAANADAPLSVLDSPNWSRMTRFSQAIIISKHLPVMKVCIDKL